jgi:branched-chain amino acid transport system substrate-binding protein
MKTLKFSSAFCIATLAATLVAQSASAAVKTVKMGAFFPMSGNTATFGEESVNGLKMAVDEINAQKGPVKLTYILEDEKSEVTDSANAAKKLINVDKVDILVGSVASSNTNAAAPIAQAAHIPLLTPASTNVNVTQKGEYISRICFIDDFQGTAMAKFAHDDLKAKKAALVIDSTSDYSMGLGSSFKDAFKKLGGEVVVEVSYAQKDQDFSSQLTKIRTRKPDVIFVPGYYTEVGNMIRQAKTLGIHAPFLGGDGWSSPELFELAGDAIVGNYYSSHFSPDDPDPKVQNFVKKYKARYKSAPSDMSALGYDAAYVIADAAKRAKGAKLTPVALKDAINSTKGFPGVTGTITLDKNRNASKPLVILQTQRHTSRFFKRVNP